VKQLLDQRGVELAQAQDWITDDSNFEDALHLSDRGAMKFSQRIANYIAGHIANHDR
jgi:hypothetical protein